MLLTSLALVCPSLAPLRHLSRCLGGEPFQTVLLLADVLEASAWSMVRYSSLGRDVTDEQLSLQLVKALTPLFSSTLRGRLANSVAWEAVFAGFLEAGRREETGA